MRIIIIMTILLHTACVCHGATYYVKNGGSDMSDGLSESAAWETIDRVNRASLLPGDEVLFKRGDTWRGQLIPQGGSVAGAITYGAYGKGEKPLILGSVAAQAINDWIDQGNNIWSFQDPAFAVDVGNLIFDDGAACGLKVDRESDLNGQGAFWHNPVDKAVNVYSAGNPAAVYSSIECALSTDYAVCELGSNSYIIIENLEIKYGGAHGIHGYNAHDITIRGCTISFCGGGYLSGTMRYGNGIEINGYADTIVIEKNTVSDCYDAGITIQGNGDQSNIAIINNIVTRCEYSFEFWNSGETKKVRNVLIANNTFLNAGGGWGHLRPYVSGTHFMFFHTVAEMENVQFKNNILRESADYSIRWQNASNIDDVVLDYNCFYESAGHYAWVGQTHSGRGYHWAEYRFTFGQDSHSLAADPMLIDDFRLSPGSACIDAGIDLDGVTDDYGGNPRPAGARTDIGAYEYGAVFAATDPVVPPVNGQSVP